MNWRVDVVLSVLFGAGCGVAALGVWRWDRRRLVSRYEKRRLAAEAESDRLRLRISALRAAEQRAAESAEELARLRPVAERVPVLEEELAVAGPRADRLDQTEDQLTQARLELEQLTGRLDTHVHRRRRAARELQTVSAMAAKAEQDAAEARSMVAAAQALVARRDETILALEKRLARLDEIGAADGSAPGGKGETVAGRTADRAAGRKGKKAKKGKAGKKGAGKKAGEQRAAGREDAEDPDGPVPVDGWQRLGRPASGGPTPSPILPGPDNGDGLETTPGVGPVVGDAGRRDDLQAINGIGPVLERALNSHGITSWEQLAGLDDAEVARLSVELPGVPGRIEREEWVAQAATLVERFPLGGPDGRPRRSGSAPHHRDPA